MKTAELRGDYSSAGLDYGVEQGMLTRLLAPEELFQRDGEPVVAEG